MDGIGLPASRGQRRGWQLGLGRAAPWTLGAWAALSVMLRFAAPGWFDMNPMHGALRGPASHASFAANVVTESSDPIGDAAREANLPPSEFRDPIRFSTDERGFRANPFLAPGTVPQYLIVGGASYTYGASLSDEETIAAQLHLVSGMPTYAISRYLLDGTVVPDDVAQVSAAFGAPPRVAILVILEPGVPSAPEPEPEPAGAAGPLAAMREAISSSAGGRRLVETVLDLERELRHFWAYSPMDALAVRARKRLSDDRILPNEYRRETALLRLPMGRMIVREYELAAAEAPRPPDAVDQAAAYADWWRGELARLDIGLHVLLMPTRYTVYGEVLERGEALARIRRGVRYLEGLAETLEARGIPVTSALDVFRRHRAEELRTGNLSFYREDHHWTPIGVRRVAEALAADLAANHGPIAQ